MEYLEDAFTDIDQPRLLPPHDFLERARIRTGIALFQETIPKAFFAVLMNPSEDNKASLSKAFADIEKSFPDVSINDDNQECLFYSSKHGFSMFECACLPFFQRTLSVLKALSDYELDASSKWHVWYNSCLRVPAFAETILDPQYLIDSYAGKFRITIHDTLIFYPSFSWQYIYFLLLHLCFFRIPK